MHKLQNDNDVKKELSISKKIIEEKLGKCDYLAFPNGRTSDISDYARRITQKCEYKLAFTTVMKDISYSDNKLFLPRYIAPEDFELFKYITGENLLNSYNKIKGFIS